MIILYFIYVNIASKILKLFFFIKIYKVRALIEYFVSKEANSIG